MQWFTLMQLIYGILGLALKPLAYFGLYRGVRRNVFPKSFTILFAVSEAIHILRYLNTWWGVKTRSEDLFGTPEAFKGLQQTFAGLLFFAQNINCALLCLNRFTATWRCHWHDKAINYPSLQDTIGLNMMLFPICIWFSIGWIISASHIMGIIVFLLTRFPMEINDFFDFNYLGRMTPENPMLFPIAQAVFGCIVAVYSGVTIVICVAHLVLDYCTAERNIKSAEISAMIITSVTFLTLLANEGVIVILSVFTMIDSNSPVLAVLRIYSPFAVDAFCLLPVFVALFFNPIRSSFMKPIAKVIRKLSNQYKKIVVVAPAEQHSVYTVPANIHTTVI